jgi:hypothetical protein
MLSSKFLVGGAVAVITMLGLPACSSRFTDNSPMGRDAEQYGIPYGSVPPDLLKPNGTMDNGLLPAQPWDTGG